MRKILLLILLFCGFLAADSMRSLTFAPLPMKDAASVYRTFAPMVRSLERVLGRKITYKISASYGELLDAIQAGEIDITYLGPLPYAVAKKTNPNLKPLVAFNEAEDEATYACVLAAWAPKKEQYNLNNLSHTTTFALTSPLSTCGFYAVDTILKKSGHTLESMRFAYLGKHDKVALSVVRGEFLYGGLKEAIARQYEHLGLEIVARLDNMPGLAIVVDSSRVDVKTQEIIKKTLLETKKEDYSHWGEDINKGMHPVEEDAYRNFKNMLHESEWEIKP